MWVQDLGPNVSRPVPGQGARAQARILTMDSPFGELTYLAPVAQFSETAAYWDKPPVPLGASRAEWL
jgi:hypothetical protein